MFTVLVEGSWDAHDSGGARGIAEGCLWVLTARVVPVEYPRGAHGTSSGTRGVPRRLLCREIRRWEGLEGSSDGGSPDG